jgi:hypothetical protein
MSGLAEGADQLAAEVCPESWQVEALYMVDALKALKQEYAATIDRDITLDETAEMLLKTARVMSEDIAAWQELYGRKRLSLPT